MQAHQAFINQVAVTLDYIHCEVKLSFKVIKYISTIVGCEGEARGVRAEGEKETLLLNVSKYR